MYEPYGEKKKFKLDFSKIKEDIKQKLSDLNLGDVNKTTYVIAALLLLIIVGSFTGFVSYSGKVAEMEEKYMIMEKQIQTLQESLKTADSNLNSCNNNLDSTKSLLQSTQQELSDTIAKNVPNLLSTHFMYLGRELQKAEYCLEKNIKYVQGGC